MGMVVWKGEAWQYSIRLHPEHKRRQQIERFLHLGDSKETDAENGDDCLQIAGFDPAKIFWRCFTGATQLST